MINGKRQEIIARIIKTLEEIESKNMLIDKKKFIIEICVNYGISGKTATEYLQVAKLAMERRYAAIEQEQIENELKILNEEKTIQEGSN